LVSTADIERAPELIAGHVRETPVLPAGELSRRFGTPVVLKAECLQLTGSFKVRGVFHKMDRLSRDQLDRGVVAASAGNHAQAVALAAHRLNSRADLFMPSQAPLAKLSAVRAYGDDVHLVEGSYEEAGEAARAFAEHEGKTLVPPFDEPAIVAGQGSVGLEIARQER
jgi:threonine dehydratase